jgi:hypothetical protein
MKCCVVNSLTASKLYLGKGGGAKKTRPFSYFYSEVIGKAKTRVLGNLTFVDACTIIGSDAEGVERSLYGIYLACCYSSSHCVCSVRTLVFIGGHR